MIPENKNYREICYKCFRPKANCYCSTIEPFPTNTKFIILIHPKEAYKQKTGTGRLAHLCLKNSELITGIDFSISIEVNEIISNKNNQCFLLYPSETAVNITKNKNKFSTLVKDNKTLVIFILDATWRLAKKMYYISKNLQTLPALAITPKLPSTFKIKKQPSPDYLSTIEVIHQLIEDLNDTGKEDCTKHSNLLKVFHKMVDFQLDHQKNNPSNRHKR